jgi:4-hydroxy-2-oxoheptanedioate aldolase
MGLMHFNVTNRSQVDTFLRWMRYPPDGDRSAYSNVIADLKAGEGQDVNQLQNDQTMLVIQIESAAAVEGIEEIVKGGGISVVEVGRADLSQSYGVAGQRRHPTVLGAVDKVVSACAKWDVAVGAGCDSRADAEDLIARGVRYLMGPGNDFGLLNRGYRDGRQMLQTLVEAAQQGESSGARSSVPSSGGKGTQRKLGRK